MPNHVIVSQGRIADRTAGAIPGAMLLARALSARTGLPLVVAGQPSASLTDHWDAALQSAHTTLRALSDAVAAECGAGQVPLVIANTCSASIATLPAAARAIPGLSVLWVDAHGDFNTPDTTGSGYLGGMALAAACGVWDSGHGGDVDPKRVILLGARDIDPPEDALLTRSGVSRIAPAAANASSVLAALGDAPVWLHIDWDVMQPGTIPAAYTVPDGLLPDQLRDILAAIPPQQIAGIELAEFELPETEADAQKALGIILDIVSPLFG